MSLSDKLKQLRETQQVSQGRLAAFLDWSPSKLGQVERATYSRTDEKLLRELKNLERRRNNPQLTKLISFFESGEEEEAPDLAWLNSWSEEQIKRGEYALSTQNTTKVMESPTQYHAHRKQMKSATGIDADEFAQDIADRFNDLEIVIRFDASVRRRGDEMPDTIEKPLTRQG